MAKGILTVISGPSGSGKGTVVEALKKDRESYALSISATTRKPREYETDGVHYFFHSKEEFQQMITEGALLEWAQFCDNYYGTPKAYVEKKLAEGKNVLLEIEVQGALQIKKIDPEAVLIFMLPPSMEELRRRLTGRGTESAEVIEKRMQRAEEELDFLPQYDYAVVNNTVEQAKADIETIIKAESMRCNRTSHWKSNLMKGETLSC
ncbi:MAG: guanylate kinase [Clostridiales bacterium]|nr:guanylate kinase [Clostridiales bacterium]